MLGRQGFVCYQKRNTGLEIPPPILQTLLRAVVPLAPATSADVTLMLFFDVHFLARRADRHESATAFLHLASDGS